jgi:hypothetical protein
MAREGLEPAPALLVIAHAWDAAASGFVARHESAGAALLTPRDLSRSGWRFRVADPTGTIAVAGGRRFRLGEAGGALTRVPAVTELDLPHIAAEDRAYVAAELTAFLLAVLSAAPILVANRPTPQCLCGPGWSDARWRRTAGGLGLRAASLRQRVAAAEAPAADEESAAEAVVIAGRCVASPNPALADAAVRLAAFAGASMLTVEFDSTAPDAAVLRARPFVDLADKLADQAAARLFRAAAG